MGEDFPVNPVGPVKKRNRDAGYSSFIILHFMVDKRKIWTRQIAEVTVSMPRSQNQD